MKAHNEKVKSYLSQNGIEARVKLIEKGSLKGSWRIYAPNVTWYGNHELQNKMIELGFKDYFGTPLNDYSGNGGAFMIFARFDFSTLN
jgi:hypothetical protein